MMGNTFIDAINGCDGPLLGCGFQLPPFMPAKIVARAGFQWVMIDMEHTPYTAEQATYLVHTVIASSAGRCLPIIRVPSHHVEWIKWALDSGAAGIIIPMVNSAEEMKAIIHKALYPPAGARSFGPSNAPFGNADPAFTVTDYYETTRDDGVAIIPMIETREGVAHAEAILELDGVSAVFIGPQDLRLSLGLPRARDGPEPEFTDAVNKIISIASRLGKPVGSMGIGAEVVKKNTEAGMKFLVCSIDGLALLNGLACDLRHAQSVI